MGDASRLTWGSFVYVLGYPQGYPMVTRGIVSLPAFAIGEPVRRKGLRQQPLDRPVKKRLAALDRHARAYPESHGLHEPEHVKTSSHVEENYLPQYYYVVPRNQKFSLLTHLAKQKEFDKGIIFCGTRRTAEAVSRNLNRHNIPADELHGGLTQAKRDRVMEKVRSGAADASVICASIGWK